MIADAIVAAQRVPLEHGPLAQSVELCTYEVTICHARVPSSILGGSTFLFVSDLPHLLPAAFNFQASVVSCFRQGLGSSTRRLKCLGMFNDSSLAPI